MSSQTPPGHTWTQHAWTTSRNLSPHLNVLSFQMECTYENGDYSNYFNTPKSLCLSSHPLTLGCIDGHVSQVMVKIPRLSQKNHPTMHSQAGSSSYWVTILQLIGSMKTSEITLSMGDLQDPKMEVLYHIRPYFQGIFPYIGLIGLIYGRYLQFRFMKRTAW